MRRKIRILPSSSPCECKICAPVTSVPSGLRRSWAEDADDILAQRSALGGVPAVLYSARNTSTLLRRACGSIGWKQKSTAPLS